MTIAKLTSDTLREPDRENTILVKVNELADYANGSGTPAPGVFTKVTISDTVQLVERQRFAGQEFYQPAHTDTDGPAWVLGINRTANRQLFLADSAGLAVNSSNLALWFGTGTTSGNIIDSTATDAATAKNLYINPSGGNIRVGSAAAPTAGFHIASTKSFSADGDAVVAGAAKTLGFFGGSGTAKPTVAGTIITATCGTGLRSLLNALSGLGLITDTTTDV